MLDMVNIKLNYAMNCMKLSVVLILLTQSMNASKLSLNINNIERVSFIELKHFKPLLSRAYIIDTLHFSPNQEDHKVYNSTDMNSDSEKYLTTKKFTYAGHRKYTIRGGTPLIKTEISLKSGLITLSILAIGQHVMNRYVLEPSWWYGVDIPFHIKKEGNYALHADKFGHAYSNYYLSTIISDGFMYTGLNWQHANLLGGLTSFLLFFQLEYKDGKAPDYGFSPTDIIANTFGILYFYCQNNFSFLQNFTPKIMYHYSKIVPHSKAYPAALAENYNEITYFLSINMKNLLPHKYKNYWINGLEIAVGWGVRGYRLNKQDLHVGNNIPMHSRYYLGLDLNLISFLSESNNSWSWLGQTINYIKLPLPTIEVSEKNEKAYLAYPY